LQTAEHIDLFPTLAEIAAGVTIPPCPMGAAQLTTALCTMGNSLAPLIRGTKQEVAVASFSQYPRGYQPPHSDSGGSDAEALGDEASKYTPNPSPCLDHKCTMGYSVITKLGGTEYRYTEWCDFNTKFHRAPDYERNVGTELYDHAADPGENQNIAHEPSAAKVVAELSKILRRGPLTGGGWGPYSEATDQEY
jgi:hypothetical protein